MIKSPGIIEATIRPFLHSKYGHHAPHRSIILEKRKKKDYKSTRPELMWTDHSIKKDFSTSLERIPWQQAECNVSPRFARFNLCHSLIYTDAEFTNQLP